MKGKCKRFVALITVLMLVFSSSLTVFADNATYIKRDKSVTNSTTLNNSEIIWPGTTGYDASSLTKKASCKITVKRQDDAFKMYNLVSLTPDTSNASITNVTVEWVTPVKTYLAAHKTEFPEAEYGTPKALGYYDSTTKATQLDKEEKLINLIRAIKKDATTMAALTSVATVTSTAMSNPQDAATIKANANNAYPVGVNTAANSNVVVNGTFSGSGADTTFDLVYELKNIDFGLYFVDASNAARAGTTTSLNSGYQPVVIDLVPKQTGPSGHWYIEKENNFKLKYEDIVVTKTINGKETDIVREGEIVNFKVSIEIPSYNDPSYTFTAFDDMSEGFTLISTSARLWYEDAAGKVYWPNPTLVDNGYGNYTAYDYSAAADRTYTAALNANTIPFYANGSATDSTTVYFYASPSKSFEESAGDLTMTGQIWALNNGVLQLCRSNITFATRASTSDAWTYGLTTDALNSINSGLVTKVPTADFSKITAMTYTDSEGVVQPVKKSLIGVSFNYAKLVDKNHFANATDEEFQRREDNFTTPSKFYVSYDAIVNENSSVGQEGKNTNRVTAYYVVDSTGKLYSAEDEVQAWTYGGKIVKVDGDNYDAWDKEEDETEKAKLVTAEALAENPIWLSGAKFNLYKLDTTYCGGEGATSAPSGPSNTYTYYSDNDAEWQANNLSSTDNTSSARYAKSLAKFVAASQDGKPASAATNGQFTKALQYMLTQKGKIVDKSKVQLILAAAIKHYTDTGTLATNGYLTADKFTNKYDYSFLYTAGGFKYGSQDTDKVDIAGLGNVLTSYMFPMISGFSTTAEFANDAKADKRFAYYVPVKVDSCDCVNAEHYHLQAYALIWQDITSTNTAAGVTLKGLDPGTYMLVETQAPAGYNEVDSGIGFEINAYEKDGTNYIENNNSFDGFLSDMDETENKSTDYTDGYYPFLIKNYSSFQLPSTGGMGTLIFTILGILIMISVIILMLMKNRKLAKNTASFFMIAAVLLATTFGPAMTTMAVTTVNVGGGSASSRLSQSAIETDNITIKVKVNSENDAIEIYQLTNKITFTGSQMNDLSWADNIEIYRDDFEETYGVDLPSTPSDYAAAEQDVQSKFLTYIYNNKDESGGLKELQKTTENNYYTISTPTKPSGSQDYYITITGNASALDYGIYLIKGYNSVTHKNYQPMTVNAVPTQKGPLGGYYISEDVMNVTLKYADVYVDKKVNAKDFDYVRHGEEVTFEIVGEVPNYLPIDYEGDKTVLNEADATDYEYNKYYDFALTDTMSSAFEFKAADGIAVYKTNKDLKTRSDADINTAFNTAYSQTNAMTALESNCYTVLFAKAFANKLGILVYNDSKDPDYQLIGNVKDGGSSTYNIDWYAYNIKSNALKKLSYTSNGIAENAVSSAYSGAELLASYKTALTDYRTAHSITADPSFTKTTNVGTTNSGDIKNITFDYEKLREAGLTAVKVVYKATVTEDCKEGVTTNQNTASFWYRSDMSGNYQPKDDIARVYTFGLNLLKSDGNNSSLFLPGAQFNLYKEAYIYTPKTEEGFTADTAKTAPTSETYQYYEFKKAAENDEYKGVTSAPTIGATGSTFAEDTEITTAKLANDSGLFYFRYVESTEETVTGCGICTSNETAAADNKVTHFHIHAYMKMTLPNQSVTVGSETKDLVANNIIYSTGDSNGVVIHGLEPASYALIETVPPTGYNPLTEAMRFEIKEISETLLDAEKNKNFSDGIREKQRAGFVSSIKLDTSKVENPATDNDKINDAICTGTEKDAGNNTINVYYQGYSTGIYKINVKNFQGLTLPETGGMGTLLFTILGIILMATVILMVFVRSRKERNYM